MRGLQKAVVAGSDFLLDRVLRQQIAGKLLGGEAIERHVVVERLDDPIAIGIDGVFLVAVVADRVGKTDQVEPVHRHPFAVMRRGEEAIDERLDCVLGITGCGLDKCVYLFDRWRQACQIEIEAAAEGDRIGFGRGREAPLLQTCEDEAVDVVARPICLLDLRDHRTLWRH